MINNMTGLSISGVVVWNIVQQLGEEIKQYEKEKVEAFQEDKLKVGKKTQQIPRSRWNNDIYTRK